MRQLTRYRGQCAACLFACLITSASHGAGIDIDPEMAACVAAARGALTPLHLDGKASNSETMLRFFRCYGLDHPDVDHRFGTVEAAGYVLGVHVYRPSAPRGTVIIVHGYYDHAGVWRHVIDRLLEQHYAVVVYDQPGHGLSSGPRADIDSFADYVAVFREILALTRSQLPPPYHAIAHSMGCAVLTDYLLSTPDEPLRQVVFLAPLIRSAAWKLSGVGHRLTKGLFDEMPRKFRRNSSDPEFLKATRRDPLQSRKVPLGWVSALRRWYERAQHFPNSSLALTVVQGDADTTVDWKYGLAYLKQHFPKAEVHVVKGAGHQLMNEIPTWREATMDFALDALAR